VLKALFELTKPRLNFLVLLSSLAGFALGSSRPLDLWKMAEFAVALFSLAGASSALNMWIERDLDAQMPRTASRPLAAGRISPKLGLLFGLALSALALIWLAWRINPLTAWLGGLTWASYLFVYTPMKRHSSLATLVGAVPGALPPVMGWTAATGSLSEASAALFAILLLWQIPHFLAIAVMYSEEYRKVGIKVMPDEQGIEATGRQMILYAVAIIPVSLWVVRLGLSGTGYFVAACVLGLGYVAAAVHAAGVPGRERARRLLLVSVLYLPLLFTAMLLDRSS
jgi:protoheme IX farnesyltransferase